MNINGTNFQNELLVKESVESTVKYEIAKKVVETGSKTLATGALFFLHSTPDGGTLPEEYMEPLNQVVEGGKNTIKGANYIDLTAIGKIGKRKVKLRINTVDTYKNGNLTNREVNAETSINLKIKKEGEGNPAIITIPKGEKIEDTKTEIEKNEKGKK